MLTRIYNSLRVRSFYQFQRYMTRRFQARVLELAREDGRLPDKPRAEFSLLLYCGQDQLPLARECARSIFFAWPVVPRMRVVSDGSVSDEALRKAMSFWPAEVEAEQWTVSADHHERLGRPELKRYAAAHKLGRKLCALLAAAEREPTLFTDSDILWFGGMPALPRVAPGSAVAKCATDPMRSYDLGLIRSAGLSHLDAEPNLNSGVCFLSGNLYDAGGLAGVVPFIASPPDYFAEQTTIAHLARRLGGAEHYFPMSAVYLSVEDKWAPVARASFTGRSWLARHYVGTVRHWFWRDALALRRLQAARNTAS